MKFYLYTYGKKKGASVGRDCNLHSYRFCDDRTCSQFCRTKDSRTSRPGTFETVYRNDETILTMGAAGNQRIIEIGIKEGVLKVDGETDKIVFELESQSVYSEPGRAISDGNIIVLTEQRSGFNLVTLTRNYSSNYDLKFDGNDIVKVISSASTSYRLTILNEGVGTDSRIVLNMSVV